MDKKTENFVKTITYGNPSELVVLAGFLPAAWLKYGEKLKAIVDKYPEMLGGAMRYTESNLPERFYNGKYTDGWGCEWSNVQEGMEAIVTKHPVLTDEDIVNLKKPSVDMGLPHGFMYLRILDLMGFENAMMAFAEENPLLETLINKVLEYNVEQLHKILKQYDYPIILFGDDLGMQTGLAIGREKWVKYFAPCYNKLFDICHKKGVLVYMHTDGCIYDIIPDLHQCGADIINPQFRANGIDNLERVCKGRIPICLDLDRQLFPFASKGQIYSHIDEIFQRLWLDEGGLALNIEIGPDVAFETIEVIFERVNAYRFYRKNGKAKQIAKGRKS